MNVKIFRLNSGEEILSRFEETSDGFIFKDPAVLLPMRQGQIALSPWLIYTKANKGITIPKTFIAFSIDPVDELKEQYDKSFNNGIVTPNSNLTGKISETPPNLKLTY